MTARPMVGDVSVVIGCIAVSMFAGVNTIIYPAETTIPSLASVKSASSSKACVLASSNTDIEKR